MSVGLERLARRMLADYDGRTPGQLFAERVDLTIPEAYALQVEVARLREARGERVIGYKVGCTSRAIQEQLAIHEPIFGHTFDTECFASGARLSRAGFANLAIEGELAVRLARDLSGSSPSDEECQSAIGSVFPAIELHHYVLRSARPWCQELIASNGMHAGFVIGSEPHGAPLVRDQRLRILVNDEEVDESRVPWAMDGPVASLRWLAARLAEFGLHLARGQVILTGSTMRLHPVAAGSRVVFEAPPLGSSWIEIEP